MIVDARNYEKIKVGDRLRSLQTCSCGCGLKEGKIYTVIEKVSGGFVDTFAFKFREIERDLTYKLIGFKFETLKPPAPEQGEFSF